VETQVKTNPQVGRALFHTSGGIFAIIFGMVLPIYDDEKVTLAFIVGGSIVALDILFRLPIYHFFVRSWKDTGQPLFQVTWVRSIFLFLEKWLLIYPNIIRESERGKPSSSIHFMVGALIPLLIGIPLWAVVPSVVIFSFGDPAARLIGMGWGKRKVWKGGTKTWMGFVGYCYIGATAGVITIILNEWFPLYPATQTILTSVLAVGAATCVGAYFEAMCERDGSLVAELIDDNLLAPLVGSVVFYTVATG